MTWSLAQILDLAPDPASRKAGQELGRAGKWSLLGQDGRALWGEIKGSGAQPYRAQVDLQGPAFKCSCPSRKFPCKHGLGLFLIFGAEPAALAEGAAPDWVATWIAGRDAKARPSEPAAPRDEASQVELEKAQQKRRAAREAKVADGLDELELWLSDLLRRGLAAARSEGYGFWDRMGARLVDAQAPGLARRVRALAGLAARAGREAGDTAAEGSLAAAVGRLALLLKAARRLDSLDEALADELRAAIGFPLTAERLAAQPEVADRWVVLAQQLAEDEDRLRSRALWLVGERGGRVALVQDYAAGSQAFPPAPPTGRAFEGSLTFHPGSSGLRASLRGQQSLEPAAALLPGAGSIAQMLDAFAAALARTPWLERWPALLRQVRLARLGRGLAVTDGEGLLPLVEVPQRDSLLAVSQGRPFDLFGLWDGEALLPLALAAGGGLYDLPVRHDDRVRFLLRRVA